ncbi:MAG: sirohydrochlorin cobaltochelatase, partial [Lachnospiraceae bacterium]|nr:sirohydrochlorin cobaltochelatase [Lachnospiraceae bacterium]
VAGDHANNDMAGPEEDSWKSMFEASGKFDSIDCQIAGLGRIKAVQELYVKHTQDVLEGAAASEGEEAASDASVEDGTFKAAFKTDSPMFHVNEALDGMGDLTVKDGQMTIHISLASKNIVNLFPGTAEDAQKDGAQLLEPTEDTIEYADGTSEEVYGFDVPVPAFDTEFDLALIGTKGVWYDHKVVVESPR